MKKYEIGELIDLQSFLCALGQRMRDHSSALNSRRDQHALIMAKAERFFTLLQELDLPVSARAANVAIECLRSANTQENGDLSVAGQNRDNLQGALDLLANVVGEEMHTKLFLMLPAARVSLFEQSSPIFGDEVADAFPGATAEDIAEAGMCLALGRCTAAVFHLMRALENAVQVVADELGATVVDEHGRGLPWGVVAENMRPVIDRLPKGSDEQVKWYRVQSYLVVLNRAWRAPTAHPKQTYTAEEAEAVFNAAKSFMQELASLAQKKGSVAR